VFDYFGISIRRLHCVQRDGTTIRAWNLAGFKRLMSIRIDWLHLHFTPFDSVLGDAEFMPFVNVECPVKAVEIRGLRYPSPMIVKAFTAPFLHMTTLELECLRIWCGLCHTCTLVRFSFPRPTGFLYEGGLGLPVCEISFKFRNQTSSFIGTLCPRFVFP
jgi:hypothetical protein